MEKNIYLVSQDLWNLFSNWAMNFNFNIPDKDYFNFISHEIISDLQYMFNQVNQEVEVKILYFDQIKNGIGRNVSSIASNYSVISLDKVYFSGDFQLEINRTVCEKDGSWKNLGEVGRPGFESISDQIKQFNSKIKNKRVAIIDDGCWSGDSMLRVIKEFHNQEIDVEKISVGILIDNGKIPFDIPLDYVFRFQSSCVVDWICERDFFVGAPFGGRTVAVNCYEINKSYGAYYLFGMGDYANWASLSFNENLVKWFTLRCIERSIDLFETIEIFSRKAVLVKDLSRLPYGVDLDDDEKFIDVLKNITKKI